jgi:Centromere DNA-binding protein complex CBF3 subunit, domain 2
MSQSCLNRDIALKQFLKLLQWLRVVLVQDAAVLYSRYPTCPIFHFAPFTYPSFTTFSANAAALIVAAEEKACLVFHNLPDHMARSMRGYATDLQMMQEQNHNKVCERLRELQEQNVCLELLLRNSTGSKRKKKKGMSHIGLSHLILPLPPSR